MSTISNGTDIDYQLMANLFIILQLWEEKMQIFRQIFWDKKEFLPDVSNYFPYLRRIVTCNSANSNWVRYSFYLSSIMSALGRLRTYSEQIRGSAS